MKKAIIGKKVGMTQIFDENGKVIPVTVVEAGPCVVVQKKTVENDGYEAVQVGFSDLKPHKVNKPTAGHFAKADAAPKRHLKEFRLEDCASLNLGDLIKADVEGRAVHGRCIRPVENPQRQKNAWSDGQRNRNHPEPHGC